MSFYEGVLHIYNPTEITSPLVSYIVLGLSFLFEAASWTVAWKEFRSANPGAPVMDAVRRSKDPPSFIVLFEDSAALIGLVIALAATLAARWLGNPVYDGVGSLCIALVLADTAALLARESKGLLIGEPASEATTQSILRLARRQADVAKVNALFTVHLAPHQILAALSLDFADDCSAAEIEAEVEALEREIRAVHPEIKALFVKPQSATRARSTSPSMAGEALDRSRS